MSNLERDFAPDDHDDSTENLRPAREGLPPAYRMRADRHYVDELTRETTSYRSVPVDDIDPPEDSGGADTEFLGVLSRSIRTHGVVHPLLVYAEGGRYRIIAGRKRFAAARAAGLSSVPCVVHRATQSNRQALADADSLQATSAADPRKEPGSAGQSAALRKCLAEEFAGIDSARRLLADEGPTVAWRSALDLLDVHTARAAWLVNASRFVESPGHSDRRRPLGALIDTLVEQFAPESRLRGITLRARVDDRVYGVRFVAHALSIGLSGAVVALLPFVDIDDEPALMISAARSGPSITVDLVHRASKLDAVSGERFFDTAWTLRPGGWPAALGAWALKCAVDHHGGEAACEVRQGEARLRLTFPERGVKPLA